MSQLNEIKRRLALIVGAVALLIIPSALATAPAAAAELPSWRLDALANTTVAPGEEVQYAIQLTNYSHVATDGSEIDLQIDLPAGLEAREAFGFGFGAFGSAGECEAAGGGPLVGANQVECRSFEVVNPNGGEQNHRDLGLTVAADPGLPEGTALTAHFQVSGGGAANTATSARTIIVSASGSPFGLSAFDSQFLSDSAGDPATAAASHPFASSTSFDFNAHTETSPLTETVYPVEPFKDALVDLPPGIVGNPNVAPTCTASDLANTEGVEVHSLCAPASQVGSVVLRGKGLVVGLGRPVYGPLPLYKLKAPPGVPAEFGFNIAGSIVTMAARVRSSSDYGLSIDSRNAPEGLAINGLTVGFWGVPAAPVHELERSCPGVLSPWQGGPSCVSEAEPQALLRLPTACTAAGEVPTTTIHVDSWYHQGTVDAEGTPLAGDPNWVGSSVQSHKAPGYPYPETENGVRQWGAPVGIEDCEAVPFEPKITVQPTTDRADSPTGLNVDLAMPQACFEPKATAAEVEAETCQADVKDVRVTQPVGTRINPATGDGLTGCSEAQIGYIGGGFPLPNPTHFTNAQPSCPDSSKIGSVEIESPLLPDKLEGAIYQARQNENPFGSTLAFYAVAYADGVMVKLPAEVVTDPHTGQVTTIFRDSPQLPFKHYRLHFFGGSRAPLMTPPTCGAHTTVASLSGWAEPGEAVHREDTFQITEGADGSPCPNGEGGRPFSPSFEAGTANPLAGAFSPFVLKVGRGDGMQELSGIEARLPEGLLGKLAGVPYCPEQAIAAARAARGTAEQAAASCPAASQLGVTDAVAGAGATPLHVPGKVYLAGPYKDAPLSLVIVTPALAGPLDLGDVVVRAALRVDPETTRITTVSDPLPTTLLEGGDGFPLDLRQIVVQIDRPQFTVNPTSCQATAVDGVVSALQGAAAKVSDRFQVGGCDKLAFKPRLSLRLKGQVRRAGHPALRATLTMPPQGQSNIARATVSLPHSEFLASTHLAQVCTRVQYAEDGGGGAGCPKSSVYGHAIAYSPLLGAPLEGNVYLRSNGGERELPDLVASLGGQIHVDLVGYVGTNKKTKGLRTSFATVPDAPVSKFVLTMPAGRHSLLENSTDICHGTHRAIVQMDAHDAATATSRPKLRVAGCGKDSGHRRKHR